MTDRLDYVIQPPPREEDIRDAREAGRETYEEVMEDAIKRRQEIHQDVVQYGDFTTEHDADEHLTLFRLKYRAGLVVSNYTATWELDTDVKRTQLPRWAENALKLDLEDEPDGLYIHPTELTAVVGITEEEMTDAEPLEETYKWRKTRQRLADEVHEAVLNILQSGEHTETVYISEFTAQTPEGYETPPAEMSEDPGEPDMTLTYEVSQEQREVGQVEYEVDGLLSHEAVGELKVIRV